MPAIDEYIKAKQAWEVARKNFDRNLQNLARAQRARGGMPENKDRGLQWHLNYAYRMYEPAATRYLRALHAYAAAHPELMGQLMDEYLNEAGQAQQLGAQKVATRHLASVKKLTIEATQLAHQNWVLNGNDNTISSVLAALVDAHMMGAQDDSAVSEVAEEIFDLLERGEVRRKAPPKKVSGTRPRREPILGIHRTLNF